MTLVAVAWFVVAAVDKKIGHFQPDGLDDLLGRAAGMTVHKNPAGVYAD
jgi:hypothetical protein